jgi:hypothetical protein
MLKKLILLFMVPLVLIGTGCGNSNRGKSDNAGMSVYDLTSLGQPLTINVPDTSKTKLEPSAQSSGSIVIKSGKDFQITITPGEGDIALKKSDISGDDVKKFKRFVLDEPNSLIWESQVSGMESEFHFYTVIKIGKESFVIEDLKDADNYTESAIKKMVEAAGTLKAKEAKSL